MMFQISFQIWNRQADCQAWKLCGITGKRRFRLENLKMVRATGLEPARLAAHAPQASEVHF